ncbi:MAG: hypothetical protein ACI4JJ_07850 [Huintestinicola sp.]
MNVIKGMIIKDLTLGKKVNLYGGLTLVIFVIMTFLFRFAYIYGNLADPSLYESEEDMLNNMNYMDMWLPLMLSPVSVIAFSSYIFLTLDQDFKCRWFSVQYASGISESKAVSAKIIETTAAVLFEMAVNFIVISIYSLNFPREYSGTILLAAAAVIPMIGGIFMFLEVILMYKFKKSESVQTVMLILLVGIIALLTSKMINSLEIASDDPTAYMQFIISWLNEHIRPAAAISAAGFAAACIVTYLIGVSFLKRREKICGD